MSKLTVASAVFFIGTFAAYPAWGQSAADGRAGDAASNRALADFDMRDSAPTESLPGVGQEQAKVVIEGRRRAIATFLASPDTAGSGVRIVPGRYGLPKTLFREGRALSAPSTAQPEDIARTFLRTHPALFPFTPSEVDGLRLVVRDVYGGAVFLTFNQTLNGIDVFNGQIKFTLSAAGEVIHAGADEIVPELSVNTVPRLNAQEAVSAAFGKIGMPTPALSAVVLAEGKTGFRNPRGGTFSPITAELAIFPMTAASARLAYRIFLEADAESWYEMLLDAESGDLLFRRNLYVDAAQTRVSLQSAMDTDRQLVTFPNAWMPATGSGQMVPHEYAHGVSNRLVGAQISTTCLNGVQSGAMAEGWSDYFSISFYNDPVEGAYLVQGAPKGIRRHSYEGYPFTYEDFGNAGYEVHNDGEIWAATLWDLRTALGQSVTDLLVINGLKSTPCHPSMTDARDAILAADRAANAGANRATIWQVFAKHGLGFSAAGTDGNRYAGIYYNAAYDQPVDFQPGGNPAITSIPPSTMPQMGDQYSYTVTASNPAAGTLGCELTQGPVGMTIDGSGVLRWTTEFTQQRVKVTVTDGKGGKVVHGFMLTPDTTVTAGRPILIHGVQGDQGYASFTVQDGVPALQVMLRDGLGDADLDLFDPNGAHYWSDQVGTNETVSLVTPKTGRWRIMASGYRAFSGVSLRVEVPVPASTGSTWDTDYDKFIDAIEPSLRKGDSTSLFLLLLTYGGANVTWGGTLQSVTANGSGVAIVMAMSPRTYINSLGTSIPWGPIHMTSQPPNSDAWRGALIGSTVRFKTTIADSVITNPPNLAVATQGNAEVLTVTGPTLSFPAALSFNQVAGGAAPASQSVALSMSGGVLNWTATAATSSGGSWLSVTPATGSGNATLQVSVAAGLAVGSYSGTITIAVPGASNSPAQVRVSVTVTLPPALAVVATPLSLQAVSGQNSQPQALAISNSGGGTLSWTTAAATTSGGNWLSVSPASGTGNATVQVSAVAASLAAGSYSGTITITATGAANSPAAVQVSLMVTPAAPAISSGGIVGGGGSIPAVVAISPGGLATIFGSSFAPAGTARAVQADDLVNGNLPTSLAGACVQVDGKPGFLTFVSPGQINFQVPAVSLDTSVNVVVVANCGASNELRSTTVSVRTAAAAPEFLYWVKNASGKNPVVAVNAVTGGYVGAPGLIAGLTFAPAKPGDILTIYGVSFGPTAPAFAPGEAPGATGTTVNAPGVSMGSVTLNQADVLYAGVSPGIAGLYQLNIRVPANLPDGDQPLTLTLGSFKTPSLGFVTVRAIDPPPTLTLGASGLTFQAVVGQDPPAQSFAIVNFGVGAFNWTATAAATGGGNWLRVSPASGSGDGTLQVSVSAASLAAGSYTGTIVISAAGAINSPASVQVTLTVAAPPRLTLGASTLAFQTSAGLNPVGQSVTIANSGGGTMSWTASAATAGGGNWLSVSPASGTGNGTLQVSVSAASLAAGSYTGTITVASAGVANSPATVQVTLSVTPAGSPQQYTVSTVAGTGATGSSGDGGQASQANIQPDALALDRAGNIYVGDSENKLVRKVDVSTGIISTVAGGGTGGDGGPATSASVSPDAIAIDDAGNLYIAEKYNNRVRKVTAATGKISTIVGTGTSGFGGDGGPATQARLSDPTGLAVDRAGNLYIADLLNNRIRMVSAQSGLISTVVGNGQFANYAGDGLNALAAPIIPDRVVVDDAGSLYFDSIDPTTYGLRVLKMDASNQRITTVAGNGSVISQCVAGPALTTGFANWLYLAVDNAHNVYMAQHYNACISRVAVNSGTLQTIAGSTAAYGFSGDGGPATSAGLRFLGGLVVDDAGRVFFSDNGNNRVRVLTPVSGK